MSLTADREERDVFALQRAPPQHDAMFDPLMLYYTEMQYMRCSVPLFIPFHLRFKGEHKSNVNLRNTAKQIKNKKHNHITFTDMKFPNYSHKFG